MAAKVSLSNRFLRVGLFLIFFWLCTGELAFGSLVSDYFGHLSNAPDARDFYTRRPVPSELTRIKDLLRAVNDGEKSQDDVNESFATGVHLDLEPDLTRNAIHERIGRHRIGIFNVSAPSIQGKWVLTLKKDRILSEIIESLANNVSLIDFLTANQINRLVLQPERSQFALHLVVSEGQLISREPSSQVLGLTILLESVFSPEIDHLNLERSTFYPHPYGFRRQNTEHHLIRDLFEFFWFSAADPENGYKSLGYRSLTKGIFETLGFSRPDQIISIALQSPRYLLHFVFMLGAMGYRFNPGSPNTGYFSTYQNEDERNGYLVALIQIAWPGTSSDEVTSSAIEQFVTYYERVAAAFKLLEERNLIPRPRFRIERRFSEFYIRWFEIFKRDTWTQQIARIPPRRNFAIFSYENAKAFTGRSFQTLYLMDDVVALAEELDPIAFAEYQTRGREKHWDFSEDRLSCDQQLRSRSN